ncbi:hypothetical protein G7Y89_g4249 [Cudoniella acicularis]|uniref:Cytochrome P450 n=1 Tax=Cudoniella acicularis TaxID=354080 RepID=A0A8H4RS04_9HELO|nr:hypothetical protein G7Y89_g4249 [Cudoniella acicularis]
MTMCLQLRDAFAFLATLNHRDRSFWCRELTPILSRLLLYAGYQPNEIRKQIHFLSFYAAPYLGKRPRRTGHQRRSFMTDDGTPIEMSWSWTEGERDTLPTVRYSIEPLSRGNNNPPDGLNLRGSRKILRFAQSQCKDVNLVWFRRLNSILLRQRSDEILPKALLSETQLFFAFDLLGSERILKVYYVLEAKARDKGCSKLDLLVKAVDSLSLDSSTVSAFNMFLDYMQEANTDLEVEMLGFDCLNPSKSRIKIYVRSQRTSFDDVIDCLTFGGKLQEPGWDEAQKSLWNLWKSVLSLSPDTLISEPLRSVQHRTAGILYYYELKPESSSIKSKLYIPVRHYGVSDGKIATGLSSFLESKNMRLQGLKIRGGRYIVDQEGHGIRGPSRKWPNGQMAEKFLFGRDLSAQWQRYGSVYRLWSGLFPEIVLTTPEDVKSFYSDALYHEKARSSNGGWVFHQLLGDCLGLINGHRWARLRKLFEKNQFDSRNSYSRISACFSQAKEHVKNLYLRTSSKDKGLVGAAQATEKFPIFYIASIIYGELDENEKSELWSLGQSRIAIMRFVIRGGIYRSKLSWIWDWQMRREVTAFKMSWLLFNRKMARKNAEHGSAALISQLWQHVTGTAISREEKNANLKEILQTLDEILFANLDVTTHPSAFMLPGNSQAFTIPEYSTREKQLGGYIIPPRTSIIIDAMAVNIRNPFWGADSQHFRPQRFMNIKESELRYNLFTFGFGLRKCLGQYEGEVLVKAFVAEFFAKYTATISLKGGKDHNQVRVGENWIPPADVEIKLSLD